MESRIEREGEREIRDSRPDPGGFNKAHHLLKLLLRPHQHAPDRADGRQTIQHARLLLALDPAQKPDHADDALGFDRLERLRHGIRPADLDDMGRSLRGRARMLRDDLLGRLAPGRVGAIVEDEIGAEVSERLGLVVRARRRDHARVQRLGELQREQAHPARALHDHPVARPAFPAAEAHQSVPRRHGGAAQGGAFAEGEPGRHPHEPPFRVYAVGAEDAVDAAAEAGHGVGAGDGAVLVGLVELAEHAGAWGESGNTGAGGDDGAGGVGQGDDGVDGGEGVFALGKEGVGIVGL